MPCSQDEKKNTREKVKASAFIRGGGGSSKEVESERLEEVSKETLEAGSLVDFSEAS